jgi:hypothetical protein
MRHKYQSRTEQRISEESLESNDEVSAGLPNSTDIYNAMIHPFTRMVIKGVIWYQGISLMLTIKCSQYDFR